MEQLPIARSTTPPPPPFKTLVELRTEHNELLRKQRASDSVPGKEEVMIFVRRAGATGALLDLDSQREVAQALIDYWTTALYRLHVDVPAAELDEFNPLLAPEIPEKDCPYVGLEAFRESTSEFFFGRQRLVDKLVERLRNERLVAVLGQSGSGKSSVAMGGLIPALRRGAIEGSDAWRYLPPIVPGSSPLTALAKLFTDDVAKEADEFLRNSGRLQTLLDRGNTPAVLVIDQFEEIFTLCQDAAAREAFSNNIANVVIGPNRRHSVVITMRSDFDSHLSRVPDLQPLIERGERMTALTAAELREAIERPAELVGLKFDDGLAAKLVADCLGEPAALPLLQFTLLKLWDKRKRNRLTDEDYKELGSGRLALERTADKLFQSLMVEDKSIAKRILLRIVRVNDGSEMMRNRLRTCDLFRPGDNREAFDTVLGKLIDARLVRYTRGETEEDDQIEVAHESLVRNWSTLVTWLEQEKSELMVLQRYEALAADWNRFDGKSGFLDDVQLREARLWLESPDAAELGYSSLVREFVEASAAKLAKESAREKSRVRRRNFAVGAVAIVAILVLAGIVIIQNRNTARLRAEKQLTEVQRQRAEKERKIAEFQTDVAMQQMTHAVNAQREAERLRVETIKAAEIAQKQRDRAQQAEEDAIRERARTAEAKAAEADAARQLVELQLNYLEQEKQELLSRDRAEAIGASQIIPPEDLGLGKVQRPIIAGASITMNGTGDQTNGASIGWVVRRGDGELFLLGIQAVLGSKDAQVYQPALKDGGTEDDVIAVVTESGPEFRSATLALLRSGISFDPHIPFIGPITGIEEVVEDNTPVYFLGRHSGFIETKITGTDFEGDYDVAFQSDMADTGSPVFTKDGKLVGLLLGPGPGRTWALPIKTLLDELKLKPEDLVFETTIASAQ